MKKVLAIIGSPRKGDTYNAVKRYEEEMNRHEEVCVDYLMLSEYGLVDCTGCHNCIMRGREFCRENRKIKELTDKMREADGVILATPVYNQHVTALMKKFMDYMTFLWHRPELFGVKFLGISSGGGMFGPVFKYVKMNVKSWGGTWVDGIGFLHDESLTDTFRNKHDKDVRKMAEKFLNAMEIKDFPKPTLGRLMMFNVWKMNAVAAKDMVVKDFEHWTETNWFNMDYYYKTRIGMHKKLAVFLLVKLMRSFMRKVYKGY